MSIKHWIGAWLGSALLFGAQLACDSGGTSVPGGGSGGSGGSGGGGGGPAATSCTLSSECTNQVCSPDFRCVDCYETRDCPVGLICRGERCGPEGALGGSGGGGGSASGGGGSGGTPAVGNQCSGAQVLFVIQRSGAMFEEPEADASYWDMVKEAVVGADGVSTSYGSKLDLGALFFVRLQYEEDMACPLVSSAAPAPGATMPLAALFETNSSAYSELAEEQAKMDAPVAEAVTAGAALLTGAARHLVLITTGVPDSCTVADSNCNVDSAIKAVQTAQQAGVTTHVIGLGNTDSLDAAEDDDGYATYLKQLANAGQGKVVAMSQSFEEDCGGDEATATYGEASGDAQAYQAATAADVKTAIAAILTRVCP
jgi:hypothetical protein